nr:hypothetical protein [Streptomyces rubellomurinus]
MLACTVVPTQHQYTGTNTTSASARPTRSCWWCSRAETWVMAKTKTRSKYNSAQVTRFSAASTAVLIRPFLPHP